MGPGIVTINDESVRGEYLRPVIDTDDDNTSLHEFLIRKGFGINDGKTGVDGMVICASHFYFLCLTHRFYWLARIIDGNLSLWLYDILRQHPINLHTAPPCRTNRLAVIEIKNT